jgi:hypothetical protein
MLWIYTLPNIDDCSQYCVSYGISIRSFQQFIHSLFVILWISYNNSEFLSRCAVPVPEASVRRLTISANHGRLQA